MDGVHDMGGTEGFGAVVEPGGEDVFHAPWEARTFALSIAIDAEGFAPASGRALRELMEPSHYLAASYYERWLWSVEAGLLVNGVVSSDEVAAMEGRLAAGAADPRTGSPACAARVRAALFEPSPLGDAASPRFTRGDRVRVRRMRPPGHNRCPRYVRGARGVVESVRGADRRPASGGAPRPVEPVYAVRFDSHELWGETPEPPWTILVDLWESYLEEEHR